MLDHVYIAFDRLGSAGAPLRMPALASAKTVHLRGIEECHIALDHDVPLQWRNISIGSSEDITLDLGRNWRALQDLETFFIYCKCLPGPICVRLTQEMGRLGRNVYCEDSGHEWWFSNFQPRDRPASRAHMLCGCQACLRCLHLNGKLPEGSTVPAGYQGA